MRARRRRQSRSSSIYWIGGMTAAAAVVAFAVWLAFGGGSDGFELAPADAHSVGPLDAPVTVVVFDDYQ